MIFHDDDDDMIVGRHERAGMDRAYSERDAEGADEPLNEMSPSWAAPEFFGYFFFFLEIEETRMSIPAAESR